MNKIAILAALIAAASAKGDAFASLKYPCAKFASKEWVVGSYAVSYSAAKGTKPYTDAITVTLNGDSAITDGCEFISAGPWMITWTSSNANNTPNDT